MKYVLNPDLDKIDWNRIVELFDSVNWDKRDPQDVEDAFRKSSITCFVMEEEMIIGFGRTVDDGRYYALLVDVVIHPEYHAQGIGRLLIGKLKDSLQGYQFITLTAAPKKGGFYHKIGWKKQTSSFIFPKDEQQYKEHCN